MYIEKNDSYGCVYWLINRVGWVVYVGQTSAQHPYARFWGDKTHPFHGKDIKGYAYVKCRLHELADMEKAIQDLFNVHDGEKARVVIPRKKGLTEEQEARLLRVLTRGD